MFVKRLNSKILEKNNPSCIGLDPRLEWLPAKITQKYKKKYGISFKAAGFSITDFNRKVIDIISPMVPVVKLQIAFYEQYGIEGLIAFKDTASYAKKKGLIVIADVKRNDISSSAKAYANTYLGKTKVFGSFLKAYNVDAITVNPFLGKDSLLPFFNLCKKYKKGIFVLVKTSNPGSKDFQDLKIGKVKVSEKIAGLVNYYAQKTRGDYAYSNIGAVVGATYSKEAENFRKLMPNSVFLVPGFGAQGAKIKDLKNFFNKDKLGAIINSSRGIVFSYLKSKNGEERYLEKIKEETEIMRDSLRKLLKT